MSHNVFFTGRISQATNVFSILMSVIITVVLVLFGDVVTDALDTVASVIGKIVAVPSFDYSLVIYGAIAAAWLSVAWNILATKCETYQFTDERIIMHFGVLNRETDYIEYFRVKDYGISKPLLVRMLGLSNLSVVSTDRSHPLLNITYMLDITPHEQTLRDKIEQARETGKGREIDLV